MVERLSKQDWVMIGEWDTPFLMDCMTVVAASEKGHKDAGLPLGYKRQLILKQNNYLLKESFDEIGRYLKERLIEQREFYDELKSLYEKHRNALLSYSKKVRETDVKGLSDDELKSLFTGFVELCIKCMSSAYLLQPLDWVLADVMKEKLKDCAEPFEILLAKLTPPKHEASMVLERTDLLQIAIKNTGIEDDLLQHSIEYGWMENFNWTAEPADADFYRKRIENEPQKALDLIKAKRAEVEEEYEKTVALVEKQGVDIRELTETIREFINIKMENWESVSRSGNDCKELFTELGRRGGLTYMETIFSSPDEILNGVDKEKAQARIKMKGLAVEGDSLKELPADEVRELLEEFTKVDDLNAVRGTVAFPGVVEGKVVIVIDANQIGKVEAGDVLVCPMTNPDFMTGAEKAVAIVTDHGGILCHAAIISREFQIPCVIGTECATKVFKDGDVVEVDAEKGSVRKK